MWMFLLNSHNHNRIRSHCCGIKFPCVWEIVVFVELQTEWKVRGSKLNVENHYLSFYIFIFSESTGCFFWSKLCQQYFKWISPMHETCFCVPIREERRRSREMIKTYRNCCMNYMKVESLKNRAWKSNLTIGRALNIVLVFLLFPFYSPCNLHRIFMISQHSKAFFSCLMLSCLFSFFLISNSFSFSS